MHFPEKKTFYSLAVSTLAFEISHKAFFFVTEETRLGRELTNSTSIFHLKSLDVLKKALTLYCNNKKFMGRVFVIV